MLLIDSDAARKLCQYQLINELATAFSCELNNFAVLPQLKYQLRLMDREKSLLILGSVEALEQAHLLIQSARTVEIFVDSANPILSINRPDIDSGESTLLAALYNTEDSLLSGDKRAYISLSKLDNISEVDCLWVRLICLEEAILKIVTQCVDFKGISEKIRSRPEVDQALKIAFGQSLANDINDVVSALESYIKNLHKKTNGKYNYP